MTLRDSEYRAGATFDLASELAVSARGEMRELPDRIRRDGPCRRPD